MTKQTTDRIFWFCVVTFPLSCLLLDWTDWGEHPVYIADRFPLLTPPFLAGYVWTIASLVVLFQPVGWRKRLLLFLLAPVACGLVLWIAYAVLITELIGGFAP